MDRLYLELFHGRKSKDETLDNWGTQGPKIGPLDYVQTTYAYHVKFQQNGQRCDLLVDEDMIYYEGVWYGDWSVFTPEGKDEVQLSKIKSRITPYIEAKSHQ